VQAIAAQPARCRPGPHRTRNELQELGLAGAIAADQQPALSGPYLPANIAQHGATAAIQVDTAERDGKMGFGVAGARHAGAAAYLKRGAS
jgi:hypothetical protein